MLEPANLNVVKTLQKYRVFRMLVAEIVKDFEYARCDVDTLLSMPRRALDFRVNARLPSGFIVQPANEGKLLTQRMDAEIAATGRIAFRVNRAAIGIHPLPDPERRQFRQIEIADIKTPVIPGPSRKTLCNVGDAVEMDIVQNDEFVVTACDNVLLKKIGAHIVRQTFCGERMLG
jgi:hypothetical protein